MEQKIKELEEFNQVLLDDLTERNNELEKALSNIKKLRTEYDNKTKEYDYIKNRNILSDITRDYIEHKINKIKFFQLNDNGININKQNNKLYNKTLNEYNDIKKYLDTSDKEYSKIITKYYNDNKLSCSSKPFKDQLKISRRYKNNDPKISNDIFVNVTKNNKDKLEKILIKDLKMKIIKINTRTELNNHIDNNLLDQDFILLKFFNKNKKVNITWNEYNEILKVYDLRNTFAHPYDSLKTKYNKKIAMLNNFSVNYKKYDENKLIFNVIKIITESTMEELKKKSDQNGGKYKIRKRIIK